MSQIVYEIPGWDKYNPRKERKAHSWFRLDKNFFTSQDGFMMQPVDKMLFLLLCCERCGKSEDLVHVRVEYVTAIMRSELHEIISSFQRLNDLRVIKIHDSEGLPDPVPVAKLSPPGAMVSPSDTLRTNVRTNEHTDTTRQRTLFKSPDFIFDAIYQDYPRKEGKTKGFLKAKKEIKTAEDFELLRRAVRNYAEKCTAEGTEKKYIKQFSTFMGCWRDYIDEEIQPKQSAWRQQLDQEKQHAQQK